MFQVGNRFPAGVVLRVSGSIAVGSEPAVLQVPTLQTLMRVEGSAKQPAVGVTIRNIGFRDAAPTFTLLAVGRSNASSTFCMRSTMLSLPIADAARWVRARTVGRKGVLVRR